MSNHIYHAGVARTDITPPIGIRLIGYAVREGVSHAIDEPLTVTALALRAGDTTTVLLSADVTFVRGAYADQVRDSCGHAIGVPASHILINCNHTHCAPALPGYIDYGTDEELAMEQAYGEMFEQRCVQACREAVGTMQPARIAIGWGECKGNINRRQQAPDGSVLMGENTDGPCDSSVGVIRVDDLSGQPIAAAFRYSCHTVTLGPKTNVISPDFIGPARSLIEKALGCPSLFLQGCAGNMNPATGLGQDSDQEPRFQDEQQRLGHALGGEVLKVAQSLRTHRKRAEPRLVQSVAVYWLYEYENIPLGPDGSIRVEQRKMELPLAPFPPLDEIQSEREEWASKLRNAQASNERDWVANPLIRFDRWAQIRLDAAQQGQNPIPVSFPVQAFQFDDFKIVAIPFEPMAETGIALRETLGPNTFVLGYSNGMISYLPTPEVSRDGGMEARLGYKNYMNPSEIPGDWEPQIKQCILNIAQ